MNIYWLIDFYALNGHFALHIWLILIIATTSIISTRGTIFWIFTRTRSLYCIYSSSILCIELFGGSRLIPNDYIDQIHFLFGGISFESEFPCLDLFQNLLLFLWIQQIIHIFSIRRFKQIRRLHFLLNGLGNLWNCNSLSIFAFFDLVARFKTILFEFDYKRLLALWSLRILFQCYFSSYH